MTDPAANLQQIRKYLKALEDNTFDQITDIFASEVVMEQLPNKIYPKGIRASLVEMQKASEKGRKLLSSQSYEIKKAVTEGDLAAVEVLWIGKLAIGFGTLTEGSEMRAHSAMFFEFKDGKIISQRNYDCFEPW